MALHVNTAQTIFGFFSTLFRQIGPLNLSGGDLVDIFNYIPLDERIHTSGQPSSGQFSAIKAAGFTHVINLAPHDAENAIADEAGRLKALDIRYTHIPVDFNAPREEDFAAFVAALEEDSQERIWVHCAANMRVSAFMFRYRRDVLGMEEDLARHDMNEIWEPYGAWKSFIAPPSDSN